MRPVKLAVSGFLSVGLAFLLTECDLPVTPRFSVEIRSDRSTYDAGDSVAVTITNHSSHTIWFDRCNWVLEQKAASDGWMNADGAICDAVVLPPTAVKPTECASISWRAPRESGTFRFNFWISTEKEDQSRLSDEDRLSNEFVVNESQGDILFSTSFEADADTMGWQRVDLSRLRNDAPAKGGIRSLFVSGGCVVPHASLSIGPFSEDKHLILRCWGKNLGLGGQVALSIADEWPKGISISVAEREWTEHSTSDTLFYPRGKPLKLTLISGGIVASAMLVDLIEVRAVR